VQDFLADDAMVIVYHDSVGTSIDSLLKCGVILRHHSGPRDGNWIHILYQVIIHLSTVAALLSNILYMVSLSLEHEAYRYYAYTNSNSSDFLFVSFLCYYLYLFDNFITSDPIDASELSFGDVTLILCIFSRLIVLMLSHDMFICGHLQLLRKHSFLFFNECVSMNLGSACPHKYDHIYLAMAIDILPKRYKTDTGRPWANLPIQWFTSICELLLECLFCDQFLFFFIPFYVFVPLYLPILTHYMLGFVLLAIYLILTRGSLFLSCKREIPYVFLHIFIFITDLSRG
ncbi:hypothetical protein ACJX0J_034771, partial [Zea mays]